MKTLRDTWLLFERSVSLTVRNPVWVVIGLVQPLYFLVLFGPLLEPLPRPPRRPPPPPPHHPLYFLVLFGPLLEPLAGAPGFPPGPPLNVFVPGLLIQLGLFGAGFVGFGLIAEVRYGVIERLRVTPVSRL